MDQFRSMYACTGRQNPLIYEQENDVGHTSPEGTAAASERAKPKRTHSPGFTGSALCQKGLVYASHIEGAMENFRYIIYELGMRGYPPNWWVPQTDAQSAAHAPTSPTGYGDGSQHSGQYTQIDC